jgi:hypothetical protein
MSGFMWKKFVSRISEADADGGSVDFGVFCVRDEHAEGFDGLTFIIRLTRTGSNLELPSLAFLYKIEKVERT